MFLRTKLVCIMYHTVSFRYKDNFYSHGIDKETISETRNDCPRSHSWCSLSPDPEFSTTDFYWGLPGSDSLCSFSMGYTLMLLPKRHGKKGDETDKEHSQQCWPRPRQDLPPEHDEMNWALDLESPDEAQILPLRLTGAGTWGSHVASLNPTDVLGEMWEKIEPPSVSSW